MTALRIPTELAAGTARSGDPARRDWLAALPARVADLAGRWGLELGEPFEPGGSAAWVAPARDLGSDGRDGADVVLKVAWAHDEGRDEAAGLAAWGGAGAVRVHRYEQDGVVVGDGAQGGTVAMLLERARPGVELRSRPEAEQHVVVTDLLRRLHAVPLPEQHPFRPLADMCAWWADEAQAHHDASPGALDPGLVRDGLALLRDLPRTATSSALLVTDLHAGNVLSGQRLPWLLVDPKPYVGDPHYDVVQHLLNCADGLRTDPVGLARHVADLAGLDADRVLRWLFARCAQESCAWPGTAAAARRLAAVI